MLLATAQLYVTKAVVMWGGELIKYDPNGIPLWNAAQGLGNTFQVAAFVVDPLANAYILANGRDEPYVTLKYGPNGSQVWTEYNPTYNGSSLAHGMALDMANNVVLTGQAHDNFDFNSTYGTYRIDTNGVCVWTNTYPQSLVATANAATAITVDQANNVYVTGYSPGTNSGNDIVTIKYDNNGTQIWVQRYNGPGNGDDEGNAIAVDASGNVFVTGYETTVVGGTEMVTIKYAPSPTGSKQTNGAFLLQTQGEPGEAFDIQATTNFTNWLDLGLTNADTNGHLQFLDTNAPLFNRRFYITKPQ
jgi:hypothetical protein